MHYSVRSWTFTLFSVLVYVQSQSKHSVNPHEWLKVSLQTCHQTPAEFWDKTWALVTVDQFCRFLSLPCFEDGPPHIDPLWHLFVIPWTITVKAGPVVFPTLCSSQRGFRHTISHGDGTITDGAETHRYQLRLLCIFKTFSITYPSFQNRDKAKLEHQVPNNYFQSFHVMCVFFK